ncbi:MULTISPECIES: glycosyltransferase family 2 protein [unclassified Mesorhizobium]|uniref:glycosyltransferase family 2 protein n=1 Tax=unclassified Mesorhizobium TaxID=325217 RepID=UPI0024150D26|nr:MULTISPECIES: glycosyltransferase family 2 protein [unclassified Mesorhizobium]MDG4854828.1 glycosyltransferase family 2 protein [Mesorhizobium sp. WSM4982]MDG4910309.1 glycosyltransferase family 2 protein [Mesorhizobium sp. WSM4898]MDG4914055.1 glycosyltransferase family 2 protein [Mesorhizobium sp. WSM4983]
MLGHRLLRHLERLDDLPTEVGKREVLCFVGLRNEATLLPYFLDHYRKLGVDRFFFLDNGSTDGTRELILEQPDSHCFHTEGSHFAENVDPPRWVNTLMNVFGTGHWCVSVDSDELLVYPDCEQAGLRQLCDYLDSTGAEAVIGNLVDMYADGPLAECSYDGSVPPVEASPYFDPKPGWMRARDGRHPPEQMFGGVRERAFWHGRFKQTLPPCLTKVPIVRWERGRSYQVAQHAITEVNFSELRSALLHFKFVSGFRQKSASSLSENAQVKEKGLEERAAYMEALERNPKLALRDHRSVRYRDTAQLVELGWMKTSDRYAEFVSKQATRRLRDGASA